MKAENILVVHKKSSYEQYSTKGDVLKNFMEENDVTLEELKENHEFHNETLDKIKKTFPNVVYRADMTKDLISKFDLIVPVGGDGTILDTSHYIFDDTPIFAINSTKGAKYSSVGFFCAASRLDLEEKIEALFSGKLLPTKFDRMEVEIDGNRINEYPLNDILIAHTNPGAMSRYRIKVNGYEEKQNSSGVWVCTAAGSTAATLSAGGKIMPIDSKNIQYTVREPHDGRFTSYKLLNDTALSLEFRSRMRAGKVFVDGSHITYDFPLGSRLTAKISDKPLTVLGFDESHRERYYQS